MTTALLDSEIVYDRITRDYAILIAGVPCGFGRTYSEAEGIRTQLLAERRDEGAYATAGELDGGADPSPSEPSPGLEDNDDGMPNLPNTLVNWNS